MRFFEVVLSGAALIAATMAVEFNSLPTTFESGKTYTITYSPKDNTPTTIKLRQGDPNNLATLSTITTTATGGSFTWSVPASLPNAANYALEIVQGTGTPNYSGLIPLTGSSVQSSSSSSSASSSPSPSPSPSPLSSSKASSSAPSSSSSQTLTTSVSASVSGIPTSTSNGTLSATRTPTATGSASNTAGGSPPQNTSAASMLASSPVAFILGAIAVMAFFN